MNSNHKLIPPSPQAFWLERLGAADRFSEWVMEQIAPYVAGSVLEIGCGMGTYTCLLARRAERVTAIDIEAEFVAEVVARTAGLSNVECRQADATQDELPAQFDCVVMLDVLEHLPDDGAMLRRLYGLLRPGGRLILKVPAHAWLFNPLDTAVGHYRRYGRGQLRRVIQASGFIKPKLWLFNRAGIAGWWLNGTILRRSRPPGGQVAGFDRMIPVLRRLERWAPLPVGLSYIAISTK